LRKGKHGRSTRHSSDISNRIRPIAERANDRLSKRCTQYLIWLQNTNGSWSSSLSHGTGILIQCDCLFHPRRNILSMKLHKAQSHRIEYSSYCIVSESRNDYSIASLRGPSVEGLVEPQNVSSQSDVEFESLRSTPPPCLNK
jgi:hypothetical protein